MSFRPEVDHTLTIDNLTYRFTEHPAAPGMPYGQTGRRATVYQVQANDAFHALKVFTPAFRSQRVAEGAVRLRPFATLPGLQVCARTVLTPEAHATLLSAESDLTYAVLMPWIAGETWQELLLGRQPFKPEQSLTLARALADILATMEQQMLAHCDLSGPNLIIKLATLTVTLVDVEEIYAPGLTRPEKLPGGSEGYAHKSAPQGLWSAEADRFAGAVLLAEILGWCDENIRQIAYSEQYFDPAEMQQNSERYQRLLTVLRERWGVELADTFAHAWHSETLMECPTLTTWAQQLAALPDMVTKAVLVNAPPAPTSIGSSPKERLAWGKAEVAEAWLELDEVDKALVELEEAMRLAPEIAAPAYARAYLKRGTQREQAGNLLDALDDYRTAFRFAPSASLREELTIIVAEVEAQIAREKQPPVPLTCPTCGRDVQPGWVSCPYCAASLRLATVEPVQQKPPILPELELEEQPDATIDKLREPESSIVLETQVESKATGEAASPEPKWTEPVVVISEEVQELESVILGEALPITKLETEASTEAESATRMDNMETASPEPLESRRTAPESMKQPVTVPSSNLIHKKHKGLQWLGYALAGLLIIGIVAGLSSIWPSLIAKPTPVVVIETVIVEKTAEVIQNTSDTLGATSGVNEIVAFSPDERETLQIWITSSPDTPTTEKSVEIREIMQQMNISVEVTAYTADEFVSQFSEASSAGNLPDIVASGNYLPLQDALDTTGLTDRVLWTVGALEELYSFVFLVPDSKNHQVAKRLALREPNCISDGWSTAQVSEQDQNTLENLVNVVTRAYLEGDVVNIQAYSDEDRLLIEGAPLEYPARVESIKICGVSGNSRLVFASTMAVFESQTTIGYMNLLLTIRNNQEEREDHWGVFNITQDPHSISVVQPMIPQLVRLLEANPNNNYETQPAVLLSPPDGESPQPIAGERFGYFTWQPSPSTEVVAEVVEFTYVSPYTQDRIDSRLFLHFRSEQSFSEDKVSDGELWTTDSTWYWRIWSIARDGTISISSSRFFEH